MKDFFSKCDQIRICSELTIKTPERCQWRRTGVFIVNFEHMRISSHLLKKSLPGKTSFFFFILLTTDFHYKFSWAFPKFLHSHGSFCDEI